MGFWVVFFFLLLILDPGFKVFPVPTVVAATAQRGQWVLEVTVIRMWSQQLIPVPGYTQFSLL